MPGCLSGSVPGRLSGSGSGHLVSGSGSGHLMSGSGSCYRVPGSGSCNHMSGPGSGHLVSGPMPDAVPNGLPDTVSNGLPGASSCYKAHRFDRRVLPGPVSDGARAGSCYRREASGARAAPTARASYGA